MVVLQATAAAAAQAGELAVLHEGDAHAAEVKLLHLQAALDAEQKHCAALKDINKRLTDQLGIMQHELKLAHEELAPVHSKGAPKIPYFCLHGSK